MTHDKTYPPPDELAAQAHIKGLKSYHDAYNKSIEEPDSFWAAEAGSLHWQTPWTVPICKCVHAAVTTKLILQYMTALMVSRYNFDVRYGPVFVKWFEGATTNVCYNALDRHVEAGLGERIAFYWQGNSPDVDSVVTYNQLLRMVCQIANYMKSIGIQQGDDVTIYMPMVPELPAVMLACARIGAVHSVVFGGFSAEALSGRILDSKPRLVVTAATAARGPKEIALKQIVDEAIDISTNGGWQVEHCLVLGSATASDDSTVLMRVGRDIAWSDAVLTQPTTCPVVWMDAEAPLFKLYTSGSTGKPKAVLHTTGGYLVGAAATFKYVFDNKASDVYWCTADCGWITGHTYVTYGPLCLGASQVLFEGVPTWPDAGRSWQIIDKYKVTVFYTAPTLIRALMAKGDAHVSKYSRASLRLLGSVGEPINPEAWRWYYEVVGDSRCPIMDTWWQTETGAHMLTPLPGVTPLKPGSATLPFFGVVPAVVDNEGNELQGECEGVLVMKRPWPSMMRTVAGDHARFESTYFAPYKGYYFTGDGCKRDADGYYWIIGRVDDVINTSGHRIGTAEIESALVEHPACAEAAVVPVDHAIKGQAIYAFVTLMEGYTYPPEASLQQELLACVRKVIGPIAVPDFIQWAPGLPKTRSGKIMRRILRKIANREEESLGDVSTLADPSVIDALLEWRGK